MTFRIHRICLVLLAACALSAVVSQSLSSQNAPNAPRTDNQLPPRMSDQTYRVSVDLVNVLCSVFDRDTNSFVTSLTREDFAIYEDGKKQEIKNFAKETNLPLTIAMLIDTSDSVAPKLKFEQLAAVSFLQNVLREKDDRALLVEFDTGVTLLQDFTGDPNKLTKEIMKLKAAGGTALYDAIYMTCDEKMIRETGRKAIVILSDGDDESSNATIQQAMEMALRAETTVFVISITKGGFFGVEGSPEGDTAMREIAKETGGRVFFPFKLDELEESFRLINQELRSQYSLGYYSTNSARDGTYRRIDVKISEKNLRPSHRKGYYAPSN
jgi:Ca-activated chloride channel homolog